MPADMTTMLMLHRGDLSATLLERSAAPVPQLGAELTSSQVRHFMETVNPHPGGNMDWQKCCGIRLSYLVYDLSHQCIDGTHFCLTSKASRLMHRFHQWPKSQNT